MSKTPEIPKELAEFVTRFDFESGGVRITIERYNNHGALLADGAWCVAAWYTQGDVPNVHYLGANDWKYKSGALYATLGDAWAAFCKAPKL